MKRVISFASALFLAGSVSQAAISFGAAGTTLLTFDALPPVAEWSTVSVGDNAANITDEAGLTAAVQLLAASGITTVLGSSGTQPPSANAIARWNSNVNGMWLQTRPTGVNFHVLMATLQNDSGAPVSSVSLTYDFAVQPAAAPPAVVEQVFGHRGFWSLTGAAGSWQPFPEASATVAGSIVATLGVGSWAAGAPLYVLWADDNGSAGADASGSGEGAFTIDNVIFGTGGPGVRITAPADGSTFAQGVSITINAAATLSAGPPTSVSFFENGNLIGSDTAAPYSVVYSNATLGVHGLTATATDGSETLVSDTVETTIVVNNPPSVTITNPSNGQFVLVGSNVTVQAMATDSDGAVLRVEFYVDGALYFTDTSSGYSFDLGDILVGSHTVTAVAVDNANARATNTISVTATNPPLTILVPNGSAWQYLDNGTDQGTAWTAEGFNDSGWSNGVAELGYGDIAQNRPERTLVGFGPESTNKYITTYFRRTFNVADVSTLGALTVSLLADDAGVVYINGVEVFRDNLTNSPVIYTNLAASNKADDGTLYTNGTASVSVLHNGVNTIAVEIHQDAVTSSDISFDLMLWSGAPAGPSLSIRHVALGLNPTGLVEVSWPSAPGYILVESATVGGPYTPVALNPSSPYITAPILGGSRFYQLRNP